MDSLIADLKYAIRRLVSRPGFAFVALATMALGIGANSAIFSIVNAVLFRPLPVEAPEQLVEIYSADGDEIPATLSFPDYLEIRSHEPLFSGVIGYTADFLALSRDGSTEVVMAERVTANYFGVLGVRAARGRLFIDGEDDEVVAEPAVVISHGMWKRRFAADPGIVGRTLTLKGKSFQIIGVAPPEFTGMFVGVAPDLWISLAATSYLDPGSQELENRESRWLMVKGRLAPGVTLEQARAGLEVLASQLAAAYPEINGERAYPIERTTDVRFHPLVDRALFPVAALLMVVVGLVLLIACTNLANLLLARAMGRRREVAIRLALGARRRRLVRQLLTESLLLAVLGGTLGLVVAYWTATLLVNFQPPLPIKLTLDLGIEWPVVAFTAAIAVLTGIAFGLAPALQATRHALIPALKHETPGVRMKSRRFSLRNVLVVTQVAVSVVLLIGAGLFVRSLINAQDIDPGFERERAAIVTIAPGMSDYTPARGAELYRTLYERISGLPGVEGVTLASRLPLGIGIRTTEIVVGGSEYSGGEPPEIDIGTVGPGYFETLRIPLLEGRDFTFRDDESAPSVVIVSEAAARRHWPGESAIGRRVSLNVDDPESGYSTVIGVARDTKVRTLGEDPRPFLYEPISQHYEGYVSLVARTAGDPRAMVATLRDEVKQLDADLPVVEQKTMGEHLSIMLFAPRMAGALLGVFGALALLLATLGLYGVVSYATAQRTREVGIRVALGAHPASVMGLVLGQGMALVATGAGLGLALALAATRPLGSLLYGIDAADPLTFIGVTLLLVGVAAVASFVPARRAARVDPMEALRYE